MRLGTASAYKNFICRCPDASEAARIDRKRNRTGRKPPPHTIDGTGSARRLQALAAIGWPVVALAERLGAHPVHVRYIRCARTPVRVRTHEAILALYRELSEKPGPHSRSARHAARRGWAPPIAWDDDTIDDPAAAPQHQAPDSGLPSEHEDVDVAWLLTGHSKINLDASTLVDRGRRASLNRQATKILRGQGLSVRQVAARLKVTERSVQRYLLEPADEPRSATAPREAAGGMGSLIRITGDEVPDARRRLAG
uniref:hypothetical protein n=1 Tax=Pseudonocardia sp. CA-138482 TaxID=3240023 RepID=UPI003F491853